MADCDEVQTVALLQWANARFMGIGAKKILDNRQIVMTLDHDVQNKSEKAFPSNPVN